MTDVEIEVPARSRYVGVVRLALASLGRVIELDDDLIEDLKIAVSEVCSNAALAGEGSSPVPSVSIRWTEEPERVVVEVLDPTTGRDEEPAATVDSQGFSSRMVMSRALVESLVTKCEIGPGPSGGTRTRLVVDR